MEALREERKLKTKIPVHEYGDRDIAADRILYFSDIMSRTLRSGHSHIEKRSLGLPDHIFMIEAVLNFIKDLAIDETPEKKILLRRLKSKALFLDIVARHGGMLSSNEAAKQLGVSKVTIKNKKDSGKLLALNIDGEFYYPVFQFTDEKNISDKGVLKGISEIIPLIKKFSDRMQYSFFMEERTTVIDGFSPKGCTFTIVELLKSGPSDVVMKEIFRLARLYGSQDAA